MFPKYSDTAGVSGTVEPSQIAEAVSAFPHAKAVYLTSPDYLGRIADIAQISEICRRNGLLLLVDNAHGAALVLSEQQHPMTLGADLCCDSAHKTLPVFTGGALSPSIRRLLCRRTERQNGAVRQHQSVLSDYAFY